MNPIAAAISAAWTPRIRRPMWQWMCEEMQLSRVTSGRPGRWQHELVPWMREIVEALDPSSPVRRVTLMKAGQTGLTTLTTAIIGYHIAEDPKSMAVVWPTDLSCLENVKQRLRPMFADVPAVAAILPPGSAQTTENTTREVHYPGGILLIKPANRRGLRNFSVPILLMDEVSAFEGLIDGDPVALAQRGVITFPRHKILDLSTPTNIGSCPTTRAHAEGDQRVWEVQCPDCGTWQTLSWEQMKYPLGRPQDAVIHCIQHGCNRVFEERDKAGMMAGGRWRVTNPGGRHRSYHISAFMSQLVRWSRIAEEYEAAAGDYQSLKVWRNQWLGLPALMLGGQTIEVEPLLARREKWQMRTVPKRAVVLTAGADVQGDRIEMYVWGWARHSESWLIDHVVISGSPEANDTWERFQDALLTEYPAEGGGARGISLTCLDTGGQWTNIVYDVMGSHRRVRLVKGMGQGAYSATSLVGAPKAVRRGPRGKQIKKGPRVIMLATPVGKDDFFAALSAEPGNHGYVHLPRDVDRQQIEQLVGEERITEDRVTGPVTRWRVIPGRRNEGLDCRVYAQAAMEIMGCVRWPKRRWDALTKSGSSQVAAPAPVLERDSASGKPRRPGHHPRRRAAGWS